MWSYCRALESSSGIYKHASVIDIDVTGDFSAVVAIKFNNFRKIVIYGIKNKPVIPAPIDCIS